MPDLDKVDGALGPGERADESADPISGIAEDSANTPACRRSQMKSATVLAMELPAAESSGARCVTARPSIGSGARNLESVHRFGCRRQESAENFRCLSLATN